MRDGPKIAYLLVTGRCNLDCAGCYATLEHWGRHTKRGELSLAQYERLIAELVGLGVRTFDISGGEPLLRLDIVEICEIIRSHAGTRIWLVSNGTLGSRQTLERLAPLVERFAVSLDAPTADLHDRLRGKRGAFDKSRETLRHAQALGFGECAVNFLLCRDNHRTLREMLHLCERDHIDRLAVLSYRDVSENAVAPDAVPAIDDLTAAWRMLADELTDVEWPANVDLVVPSFLHREASSFWRALRPELRRRVEVFHPHLRGPTAFKETIVLKPFGVVTGDTAMINSDTFEIGSALDGVEAIWTSKSPIWRERLAARERALKSRDPCASCSRWSSCRGGCPAAAQHQWGDYRQHDRTCDQFRAAGVF